MFQDEAGTLLKFNLTVFFRSTQGNSLIITIYYHRPRSRDGAMSGNFLMGQPYSDRCLVITERLSRPGNTVVAPPLTFSLVARPNASL